MKKVVSTCLTAATVVATLAIAIMPANADSRNFSSDEEHREYHRMFTLNK